MKVSVQNKDNTCSASLVEKGQLRLLEGIPSTTDEQAAVVFNLQSEVKKSKITTSNYFLIQLLWKNSKHMKTNGNNPNHLHKQLELSTRGGI